MNAKITRRSFAKNAMVAGAAALAGTALTGTALAAPSSYLEEYCAAMDAQGFIYEVIDDYCVRVPFNADNTPDGIDVYVLFAEDGANDVGLRVWSIYQYDASNLAEGYAACNEMNDNYRWVTFSVDVDNEIAASMDALVYSGTCGEELMDLVYKMVDIVDISLPVFDPTIVPATNTTTEPDTTETSTTSSGFGRLFGA